MWCWCFHIMVFIVGLFLLSPWCTCSSRFLWEGLESKCIALMLTNTVWETWTLSLCYWIGSITHAYQFKFTPSAWHIHWFFMVLVCPCIPGGSNWKTKWKWQWNGGEGRELRSVKVAPRCNTEVCKSIAIVCWDWMAAACKLLSFVTLILPVSLYCLALCNPWLWSRWVWLTEELPLRLSAVYF